MALGSSAPEILLSVIETVSNLDGVPGELGPSTIVGSAAFNMLIITACAIVPVGIEGKTLGQFPVFLITTFWATFAYCWAFIVLSVVTPDEVDLWEAILTFVFMFCLILTAFVGDKCSSKKKTDFSMMTDSEKKEYLRLDAKRKLKHLVDDQSMKFVIDMAMSNPKDEKFSSSNREELHQLFKYALQVTDLSKVSMQEFIHVLLPESIIESITYKKEALSMTQPKDFLRMKGSKAQLDEGAMV
jgi:Ca2+/Na+ antiporter